MNLRGLPVLLLLAGSAACRARLPVDRPGVPTGPRAVSPAEPARSASPAPAALPLVAARVEYYQISDG